MSTGVTKTLSAAEQIFRDLVWTPVINAGEASLFLAFPALDAPVIGAVDKEIISLASDWAFNQLTLFMDITTIKLLNSAHQAAFDTASENLEVIAYDKGITSQEFIDARAVALSDLSKFTELDIA